MSVRRDTLVPSLYERMGNPILRETFTPKPGYGIHSLFLNSFVKGKRVAYKTCLKKVKSQLDSKM
jgi:hypothetical protein